MAPEMLRNRPFWSWRVESHRHQSFSWKDITPTCLGAVTGHKARGVSPPPHRYIRSSPLGLVLRGRYRGTVPSTAPKVGLCVGWACGLCPNPRKKDLIREPLLEAPWITSPQHHLGAKKTRAGPPRRTFLRREIPDYRPSQEAHLALCSLLMALI